MQAIDPTISFTVETDVSDHTIAATLTQKGRPVAFFSHTLSNSEQKHLSMEKDTYAIVEALKKWKHYLIGHHLRHITDQHSSCLILSLPVNKTMTNIIRK